MPVLLHPSTIGGPPAKMSLLTKSMDDDGSVIKRGLAKTHLIYNK